MRKFYEAVITLFEKRGKDRALLENWRPISLVNVDTKIMSKVIAARVKKVLPSIIHYNQTGYVKDRFIGEAIRSIFDIMDFTAKENIPGLLLFIDFQKAFDSVEWEFLIESLKKFNFGRDFLQWMKTFYNYIQSCVINNGISSNFLTLERGVRQGDPLSPILGDPGADSGDEEKSKQAEKYMARRKVKNGEKSPWGQCLTRPAPNGRRRSCF